MADGIHSAVDPVEAPSFESAADCASPETELHKLCSGDDAMLSCGHVGEHAIKLRSTSPDLSTHTVLNPGFAVGAPLPSPCRRELR
jgi:hypothetical protein